MGFANNNIHNVYFTSLFNYKRVIIEKLIHLHTGPPWSLISSITLNLVESVSFLVAEGGTVRAAARTVTSCYLAMTSREAPLADYLMITSLSLSVRAFPRPIAQKYLKELWPPVTFITDKNQMAAKHDVQYNVNKLNIVAITCHAFPVNITKMRSLKIDQLVNL